MTIEELQNVEAPFKVRSIQDGTTSIVEGFSQNDPLGVGGNIFPDMPTAHFEGGGWILVADLMKHFQIAEGGE